MDENHEFFRLQEDAAHRIALCVGVTSAAKRALDELEARRAAGQDAVIWRDGRKWVVGPAPGRRRTWDLSGLPKASPLEARVRHQRWRTEETYENSNATALLLRPLRQGQW